MESRSDLFQRSDERPHAVLSRTTAVCAQPARSATAADVDLGRVDTSRHDIEPRCAIGLGSWNTQVEYRDVVVRQGEAVLYASAFDRGAPEWQVCRGDWSTLNGGYRQDARIVDCRSLTGETWWTNYTLSLRARKRGGQEGFLILFHWKDPDNWTWWNRGGCNNTQHAVEVCRNGVKSTLAPSVPGSIEIGRWCDIRVELEGTWIRCYLDDQLVHDVRYLEPGPIYGVAGWDETRRQVIVKLVNVTGETVPVDVSLEGLSRLAPGGQLRAIDPSRSASREQPRRAGARGAAVGSARCAVAAIPTDAANLVPHRPANPRRIGGGPTSRHGPGSLRAAGEGGWGRVAPALERLPDGAGSAGLGMGGLRRSGRRKWGTAVRGRTTGADARAAGCRAVAAAPSAARRGAGDSARGTGGGPDD